MSQGDSADAHAELNKHLAASVDAVPTMAALARSPARPARTLARLAIALWLTSVFAWAAAAQEVTTPGEPIDFALEETSGQTRTMAAVRGRVVVIFYEDREHTDLNMEFKQLLHRFVEDNHLRPQMTTYAVANVSGVGGGVIRDMARTAIRAVASQYGIQILLDWEGDLQSAPISMADGDANVVLCDHLGRIRWRHRGAMDETSRTGFFRTLRRLLGERSRAGSP